MQQFYREKNKMATGNIIATSPKPKNKIATSL